MSKVAESEAVEVPESEEEDFQPSDADLRLETKKFVLQALLEKAAAVLPTKDTMPVLKNFLVEATEGRIRIVATDLELSVVSETEMVKVERPGTAVFPGKRLLEIVRESDDGDLILDVVGGTATVLIGRTTWELKLPDGSEYPPIPEMGDVKFSQVDRGKFLGAINAVRYAAGVDNVRPNLMMIDVSEGRMRAADGVRFQQVVGLEGLPDIQIPINAVEDLVKLLRSTELSEVEVGLSEDPPPGNLVFRLGGDVFLANRLVVQFPDVDSVLLKPALANDQVLEVDREELLAAIKRVRITADPETRAILLRMEKPNKLAVESKDKFGNLAFESLDVHWEADDKEIAVNHEYLMEMLQMADVKSCKFFLGEDKKTRPAPILLRDDESGMIGVLNQQRRDFIQ